MKSLLFCLAAVVMATAGAVPARAAAPGAAGVMAIVNGALARANADDGAGLDTYFASDAPVVDNIAPFLWTGSHAAARWWHDLDARNAGSQVTGLHASAGAPLSLLVAGSRAYAVVPLDIRYSAKGVVHHATGTWTLVLGTAGTSWKILSATFSGS